MEGPAGRGEKGETEVRARGGMENYRRYFFFHHWERRQGQDGRQYQPGTQMGFCSCACLCKVQVSWAGGPDGYKCGLAS